MYLVVYASTEGQTRKIAHYVTERLTALGKSVELVSAAEADGADLGRAEGAILAASVHVGRYQREFVSFVRENAAALTATPTLFLSVSLAAAGDEPDDLAELDRIVARLEAETRWRPGRVAQIAGAFRFSEYDFFKTLAMRWIAAKKDPDATPGRDREYTDWTALEALVEDWTKTSAPAT